MYIESVPNRNSPPAVLLRESYREGGKVRKRTLLNLSSWPSARVDGLRAVLKGGVVIPADQEAITITRSLPHGPVAAVIGSLPDPAKSLRPPRRPHRLYPVNSQPHKEIPRQINELRPVKVRSSA
jgi:hypothetical protein